jgi:hypothetical protein
MLSECGGGGLSNNDNGFDDFAGIDLKSSRKWITVKSENGLHF